MDFQTLNDHLKSRKVKNDSQEWYASLNERKIAELEFHNRDRDKNLTKSLPQDSYELLHGNKKYYQTTNTSREYVSEWIKENAKGKVFLDYACGNGGNAIEAAKAGAKMAIGLDISDVSVNNANQEAEEKGLDNACFIQGDCENTKLPDNSIDTIICSGMLHHLDLSFAFPELRRILKPGGKILAVEALNYNPIIKIYRMITPSMRTDWEKNHILSLKDVKFAKRFFIVQNVKFWHIFSYFSAFLHKQPSLMKMALGTGNALDTLATKIPGLNLMAWQFTFEMVKEEDKD
jgi:ubiquinone/menaquinone biosynthesis C-methylase UbiE